MSILYGKYQLEIQHTMKEKAQVKQQLQMLIEILFGLHVARQKALD